VVVILKMKSKELSGLQESIYLELYDDCEFADGSAMVNFSSLLSVPVLESVMTGMIQAGGSNGLAIYPNPAKEMTTIRFSLRTDSKVSLTIFDQLGHMVILAIVDSFKPGDHFLNVSLAGLVPGIYFLKANYTATGLETTETIKLIVTR
jgi:hypothetical protein